MIENSDILSINYLKKQAFAGSFSGMRYCLRKTETEVPAEEGGAGDPAEKKTEKKTVLEALVWPEPLNLAHTDERLVEKKIFAFSREGREEAIGWLNERYAAERERWDSHKNTL